MPYIKWHYLHLLRNNATNKINLNKTLLWVIQIKRPDSLKLKKEDRVKGFFYEKEIENDALLVFTRQQSNDLIWKLFHLEQIFFRKAKTFNCIVEST